MAHKLLLADDSVTIQRVIELTFADEDIEVTAVGDGQTAIDRLDADPPDIILADIDMPGRDGYDVAAYVKSRPTLAHIPVVLLAGAFESIDQARAAAAGSSDVLAKPFEPQMVINRVKELLGRKRADAGYAAREDAPSQGMQPPPEDQQHLGGSSQTVSLDDYFDQLDAAFSNLQPGAAPSNGSDEDWPADLDTRAAAVTALPLMGADSAAREPLASMPAPAPVAPAAPNATAAPVASIAPASPTAPAAAPVEPFAAEMYVRDAAEAPAATVPAAVSIPDTQPAPSRHAMVRASSRASRL